MAWKMGRGDAYALLSALLLEERGLEELPAIARTQRGKPFFPDRPELAFSLSHSGDLALCALGKGQLGADIERVRPRREGLSAYALSQLELSWFQARGSRWEDFYTLWTLKEARVKCTGQGLSRPPREIAVPLIGPGEQTDFQGFSFTALAGEGWRGAVCQGP